jgi:hypothetical protein
VRFGPDLSFRLLPRETNIFTFEPPISITRIFLHDRFGGSGGTVIGTEFIRQCLLVLTPEFVRARVIFLGNAIEPGPAALSLPFNRR